MTTPATGHPWHNAAERVATIAAAARTGLDNVWTMSGPAHHDLVTAALAWSAPADPAVWQRRSPFRNAVYASFDQRGVCRYVGSVSRSCEDAVARRLSEHYGQRGVGTQKKATWAYLFVIGLAEHLTLNQVRAVEARGALILGPFDGSAHPASDPADDLTKMLAPAAPSEPQTGAEHVHETARSL